jgi:hypothetical protein
MLAAAGGQEEILPVILPLLLKKGHGARTASGGKRRNEGLPVLPHGACIHLRSIQSQT